MVVRSASSGAGAVESATQSGKREGAVVASSPSSVATTSKDGGVEAGQGTPEGTAAAQAVLNAFADISVDRGQHPIVGT